MSSTATFIDNHKILCDFYDRIIETGFYNKEQFDIYWVLGTDNYNSPLNEELLNKNYRMIIVENRDEQSRK